MMFTDWTPRDSSPFFTISINKFGTYVPTKTGWCLTGFNHSGSLSHNPLFVFNQRSSEAHHCQNATIEELAAISEVGEEVLRQETGDGRSFF